MHQHYEDILSRVSETPPWFDENGTPRYCVFAPNKVANIHARECALLEITCQSCNHKFLVAVTEVSGWLWKWENKNKSKFERLLQQSMRVIPKIRWLRKLANKYLTRDRPRPKLAELIKSHTIHYGDPPNIRCCGGGPSMNSIPRRVIKYWHREAAIKWARDSDLEIEIST